MEAINVFIQSDGWSCGYRTAAYMFRMAMGDTPEALANAYFDSEDLRKWLLKCLTERKVRPPPPTRCSAQGKKGVRGCLFGGPEDPRQGDRLTLDQREEMSARRKGAFPRGLFKGLCFFNLFITFNIIRCIIVLRALLVNSNWLSPCKVFWRN